jgi:hypothetical protein
MSKKLILLATCMAAFSLPVLAEDSATREERRAQWESMTDEQRAAKRDEMRARWESMSDEDRAAKKAQMRERWQNASPEQREQMRQHMHGRHRQDGGHRSGTAESS